MRRDCSGANPGNERSGASRRTTQTLGESARASKDMSPVIHGTLRGPDAGQISLRQPFGKLRPPPPSRDIAEGDCDGLVLADQHDNASGDSGEQQVPLQHG
jgi:hypothetical protein